MRFLIGVMVVLLAAASPARAQPSQPAPTLPALKGDYFHIESVEVGRGEPVAGDLAGAAGPPLGAA